MRAATLVIFSILVGCRDDPAELVSNLVEPSTATAQYFHGNSATFDLSARLEVNDSGPLSGGACATAP
jgi:hypothetical protein